MTRLPLRTIEDLTANEPELMAYFDTVRGKKPSSTHQLMAHAPTLIMPFLQMTAAVRKTSIDPKLRELCQMMVAYLAGKDYVFVRHYERCLQHGIAREQIDNLWCFQSSPHYGEAERVALQYTAEATQSQRVREETFAALRALLGSDRCMMEFVMSVAYFSFSSYVMLPCELDVGPGFDHVPRATQMPRPSWVP